MAAALEPQDTSRVEALESRLDEMKRQVDSLTEALQCAKGITESSMKKKEKFVEIGKCIPECDCENDETASRRRLLFATLPGSVRNTRSTAAVPGRMTYSGTSCTCR